MPLLRQAPSWWRPPPKRQCPLCHRCSARIHSRYGRQVADPPGWVGRSSLSFTPVAFSVSISPVRAKSLRKGFPTWWLPLLGAPRGSLMFSRVLALRLVGKQASVWRQGWASQPALIRCSGRGAEASLQAAKRMRSTSRLSMLHVRFRNALLFLRAETEPRIPHFCCSSHEAWMPCENVQKRCVCTSTIP